MSPPEVALPRISLVLLACNQEATAGAAAESCLAQLGEPLEIVLSDDASNDRTFERLQAAAAAYRGPHRVRARRNPVNLGIGGHYNELIAQTSGELIVTAAGDDLSVPHRVQRLAQAWDATSSTDGKSAQASQLRNEIFTVYLLVIGVAPVNRLG